MATPAARQSIYQIKPHMLVNNSEPGAVTRIALNSNESAFGPSPNAIRAARCAAGSIERYCENPAQVLVPAIARRFDLDPDYIAIGPGSDDLLSRLARAFLEPGSELIRSRNGYLKVPNYAYANSATPVNAEDMNFTARVDRILACITGKTRMIYLANPDNPSGTYLDPGEISRLHSQIPEHVLLVLDCAYEEYVDAVNHAATQRLVERAGNVVMTRTFSKIFGLAGARIGWLYAHPDIVDVVNRIGLTFPVATPSLAAALSALDDSYHTRFVYDKTRQLREWLSRVLAESGLIVYSSQANFILVEFPDTGHAAQQAYDYLNQNGISTRRFASPAFHNCIRITLGLEHELNRARDCLAEFLAG